MWIVKLALQRPYTFLVLAILLLILGPLTIYKTPVDILPNIDIPVVSVIWSYTGLAPDDMSKRIVYNFERTLTTTVTDVEHVESQSLTGIAVVKIFFQPTVNLDLAISQITSNAQAVLRNLPPGTTPPFILSYNASTIPVIQLALSSTTIPEQKLNDLGLNTIRTQLATIRGAATPYPYGGKQRQVMVDLNQQAMQTYGVTPQDVNNAINAQNLILPTGTQKIGAFEYDVRLNASPDKVEEMNDLPVRSRDGSVLYIRDVAHVRDGFAPQTNLVRIDGDRAVLMTVQKIGNASTLAIVDGVKRELPQIKANAPAGMDIKAIGDQSIFVKAAIKGVAVEALIAALLTGALILLFLGNWYSTLIIIISIPLSILSSIIAFSALGETINLMTLSGLALAIGILVDDATVTIENINSHLEEGKEVEDAILTGADEIAVPAFVSTLSICIVFIPMFFLSGVAKYLFIPLAEAVVFAVVASYILSRTLVPTLAKYWLKKHDEAGGRKQGGRLARWQAGFEQWFGRMRDKYKAALEYCLDHAMLFMSALAVFCLASLLLLFPWLGSDFFPSSSADQVKLHYRAAPGTRIEETARIADQVAAVVREVIPSTEIATIVDNIGIPYSGINLSYSNAAPVGPGDNDMLIQLGEDHGDVDAYVKKLRVRLAEKLPGLTFAFLPADITTQILNFGLPSPIDVQVTSRKQDLARDTANRLYEKIRKVPGIVDARIQQQDSYPELNVTVDRSRAQELGITQNTVARNLLLALSGSFQTAPTYWLDQATGTSYPVVTQAPQYRMESLEDLRNIPISGATETDLPRGPSQQILGAVADIRRNAGPTVVSHYNVQTAYDIFASVQGRDLGAVAGDISDIVEQAAKDVPPTVTITPRGQMQTQRESFTGLYLGLLAAIVFVYLLIVVNFQSWIDPLIIISALPAALTGIVWMLFITGTTISVPALIGTIMCIGVATANSILVVNFARAGMQDGKQDGKQEDDGKSRDQDRKEPRGAALEAGVSRLRPVIITATAMIIGMIPMALNLSEGGEQNAPLGRAVIGGLLFSTVATLLYVPVAFRVVHEWLQRRSEKAHANPQEGARA